MRAVYLSGFSVDTFPARTLVEGDIAHHLNKVVRVKSGESILIMNGEGETFRGSVADVSKKSVGLEVSEVERHERPFQVDLLVGLTKRDAFEDIVRSSTEMGVNKLIPSTTKFSQRYEIKSDRVDRIIESALIQSNNPFRLEVGGSIEFAEIKSLAAEYDHVVYFSSIPQESRFENFDLSGKYLIIIGPEGGMSQEEEGELLSLDNISLAHLRCPILRASTAVSVAMGFLLAKFCG